MYQYGIGGRFVLLLRRRIDAFAHPSRCCRSRCRWRCSQMESSIFQENTRPADKYAHEESPQGVAMVVLNTGLSEVGTRFRPVFFVLFSCIFPLKARTVVTRGEKRLLVWPRVCVMTINRRERENGRESVKQKSKRHASWFKSESIVNCSYQHLLGLWTRTMFGLAWDLLWRNTTPPFGWHHWCGQRRFKWFLFSVW